MEMDDSLKIYEPPVTNVINVRIQSSILNASLNPMENGDNLSEGW